MTFLVDAQLPPVLVQWLRDQDHDAHHVADVGLNGAEDGSVWDYALRMQKVVITKDEDFAERTTRLPSVQIVWLRIGNTTNPALLEWLGPRWPEVIRLLDEGNRLEISMSGRLWQMSGPRVAGFEQEPVRRSDAAAQGLQQHWTHGPQFTGGGRRKSFGTGFTVK